MKSRADILGSGFAPRVNWGSLQAEGLALWWPFHDKGGKTVSEVVQRQDAVWTSSVPVWEQGPADPPGGGLKVAVNHSDNTSIRTAAFTGWNVSSWTFCCWCSLVTDVTSPRMLGLGGRQLEVYFSTVSGGANNQLRVYNGSSELTLGSLLDVTIADTGVLYHVAVTRRSDGSTYGFINGQVLSSPGAHTYSSLDGQVIDLGGLSGLAVADWQGHLYDSRIYMREFSDADVWQAYTDPWDIYWTPRPTQVKAPAVVGGFQAAWAKGSNAVIQVTA